MVPAGAGKVLIDNWPAFDDLSTLCWQFGKPSNFLCAPTVFAYARAGVNFAARYRTAEAGWTKNMRRPGITGCTP